LKTNAISLLIAIVSIVNNSEGGGQLMRLLIELTKARQEARGPPAADATSSLRLQLLQTPRI
jgi:hypothetical protein